MALTLGVAALDSYLHWAIRRVDLKSMPRKLASIEVTFGDLVEMGSKSVQARKQDKDDRPATRARNVLNEKLLTMTFQNARQVEAALAMIGITKSWSRIVEAMPSETTAAELQERLNSLSHRRNKIVHEGDLLRQMRPRAVKRELITFDFVSESLAWLRSFIEAIEVVRSDFPEARRVQRTDL